MACLIYTVFLRNDTEIDADFCRFTAMLGAVSF
jgi:hypothetical protein